jgi:hypothetical protein
MLSLEMYDKCIRHDGCAQATDEFLPHPCGPLMADVSLLPPTNRFLSDANVCIILQRKGD